MDSNSNMSSNGVVSREHYNEENDNLLRNTSKESPINLVEAEEEISDDEENVVEGSMTFNLGDRNSTVTEQIKVSGGSNRCSPEKRTPSREENATVEVNSLEADVPDADLPDTVTKLQTADGASIYLVGTAHFSLKSQEDVAKTIQAVRPDIVLVELCKGRVNILKLDERTLLEEAQNLTLEKATQAIKQSGLVQGIMYLLLLDISAHLTKQLGMAPGGEFRRALAEAKLIPGCQVHFGDRPIQVTLQRVLAALSLFQKIRFAWHIITSKDPISKEEVEKCKQRDLLEEMLAEMTGDFPALSEVFVKERDMFLAYSLQMSVRSLPYNYVRPPVVVGVVGIGHVSGIVNHWGKVTESDIVELMKVAPPSMATRIFKFAVKWGLVTGLCYGVYRLMPSKYTETLRLHILNLFTS